ncbi:MAG: hypothetical protein FD171_671 [Actinobacteria bacterium]|nr:MAG: hypothetical protein FD171_671 [Actinomycetota bacterium]
MELTAQQYLSKGSSSPYVARTMIQTGELLAPFGLEDPMRDAVMQVSHDLMIRLVACQNRAEHVTTGVDDGKRQLLEHGVDIQGNGLIVTLPCVLDLQANVEDFLHSAKQALRETGRLFEPFYDKRFDHRFQRIRSWAKRQFGPDDQLVVLLEDDAKWIERVISLRNAVEHPGSGDGTLIIKDFRLGSAGSPPVVIEPTWNKEGEIPVPIAADMIAIMDNILTLFEDLLCDCLLRLPSPLPLVRYEIPEDQRNPSAPMRLRILPRDPVFPQHDA